MNALKSSKLHVSQERIREREREREREERSFLLFLSLSIMKICILTTIGKLSNISLYENIACSNWWSKEWIVAIETMLEEQREANELLFFCTGSKRAAHTQDIIQKNKRAQKEDTKNGLVGTKENPHIINLYT